MDEDLFIPPEYLCLVENLCEQLKHATTLIETKKIFTNFAKHYTPITYLYFILKKDAEIFQYDENYLKYQKNMKNLFKGYFENPKYNGIVIVSQKRNDHLLAYKNHIFYGDYGGYLDFIRYDSSNCKIGCMSISGNDCYIFEKNIKIYKQLIQIPHYEMEFTFKKLIQHSDFPLDATMLIKYEKACELHQKIKKADETFDNDKWFKYLLQSNDEKCINLNMKYRISKYPFCKKLWKLYIEYLENTNNIEMMLKTYSRYCRLFFKDKGMLEKYRKQLQKYGFEGICVTKFWIDTVVFEQFFVSPESAGRVLNRALKSYTFGPKALIRFAKRFYQKYPKCIKLQNIKKGSKNLIKYNFLYGKNNFISKNSSKLDIDFSETFESLFSLKYHQTTFNQIHGSSIPINVIFNVIRKSSIMFLQKLFQTCKYYNIILRRLTCYRLWIDDETKFGMYGQALFLPASAVSLNFKAIFITHFLTFQSKNPFLLSILIQKLTSCNIRHLNIFSQHFTFNEYIFLTKYGNIETLCLQEVNIFDENGSVTAIEKFLSFVPKAYDICIETTFIVTCNSLSNFSCRLPKIRNLSIGLVDKSLNIKNLCDFIMKYCGTTARIDVNFQNKNDHKFQLLLLKAWKNICTKNELFENISIFIYTQPDFDVFLTLEDIANDNLI